MKVQKSGMQVITDFTELEKEKIEKDLTLDNPAYKSAKRFSKWMFTNINPHIRYYVKMDGALLVPRGYTIPFKHTVIENTRVTRDVKYPKFKITLRKTQDEAYRAWIENIDKGVIVLPTGKGKCCNYNTLISTNEGFIKMKETKALKIRNQVVPKRLLVETMDSKKYTNAVYYGGMTNTLKITTELGYSVECTPEHKLLEMEDGKYNWRESSKLKVGDYIILKRNYKWEGKVYKVIPKQVFQGKNYIKCSEIILDKSLAYIMGLLVAEGSCGNTNSIALSNSDEQIVNIFLEWINSLGLESKHYKSSLYDYVVHSKQLRNVLKEFGLKICKSGEKEIPYAVRTSSSEIIKNFIEGYLESECYIDPTNCTIEVCSKSNELLSQLQLIFLAFGILSSLSIKYNKNYKRNYYKLVITDLSSFNEMFKFHTDKQIKRFEDVYNKYSLKNRNTNVDIIPNIKNLLKKLEIELKPYTKSGDRHKLNTYADGYRKPSYDTLYEFINLGKQYLNNSEALKELISIYSNNYFYAKIISIDNTKSKVMDISVPNTHNYIGNGFVCHNTVLGLYMAFKTHQKVLIIVQKDDLIDGWKKDIKFCLGIRPKKVGLIKAKSRRIGEQITLSTIQTLSRLSPEELTNLYSEFGMVIVDEFHHSASNIYEIVKYFQCKYLIGLTATDDRKDGLKQVLYWYFGKVAFRFKETEDDEDIMPYTVIIKESKVKYDPPQLYYYHQRVIDEDEAQELREIGKGRQIKRKPIDPTELKNLLVYDEEFNKMVAKDIFSEYKAKKSCIAFFHEKEHVRYMRELLIELGTNPEHIQLYDGDATEKDYIMKERAEKKEVLITLATFAKATEGTNVKAWERGFLVTSLNDEKNTIQAVGRLRRRKAGKKDVIIYTYDHPLARGLKSHIKTQLKAFKKTNAKIVYPSRPVISRGFR